MNGGVSDTPPLVHPSRSLFIAGAGVLLLSIPFLVFGLGFLDTRARVEFRCDTGGPCELTRVGRLTREAPQHFEFRELVGARVERRRSSREDESIYRPVLVTQRGDFPLSAHWMEQEKQAQAVVISVERFLHTPFGPGFSMWHDDRARASRVGVLFTVTAAGVMLFGLRLLWKAVRRRREERSAAPLP
jgi:hypothetical protein